MTSRTRVPRLLLLALSTAAALAVSSCSGGSDEGPEQPSPTDPVTTSTASASPGGQPESFTADASASSQAQRNAGLTALAKLPGVTGASRSGSLLQVDLAATATPEQRAEARRVLAGLGTVVTASASPAATPTPSR